MARRCRTLTKRESQRRHAARRAQERFGVEPTEESLRRIIQDIQGGRARFVKRTSLRCTVWETEFLGIPARVVYDTQRKQVVTFIRVPG